MSDPIVEDVPEWLREVIVAARDWRFSDEFIGIMLRQRLRQPEGSLLGMAWPDGQCIPDYDHEAGKDGRCIWCNTPLGS